MDSFKQINTYFFNLKIEVYNKLSLLSTVSSTTVATVEVVSTTGTNLNHSEPFKLSSTDTSSFLLL